MYVVLDTCVAIRALADDSPYRELREKIVRKCDVVAISTETLKEWKAKSHEGGMTPQILQRKAREELQSRKKLKKIGESKLQLVVVEKKASDNFDNKFLRLSIAAGAPYLFTTDRGLLEMDPYEYDGMQMRIIRPDDPQYPG